MIILADTRQQINKHKNIDQQLEKLGYIINRTKLYCGDYTLPANQSICIDSKQGLQECCSNLCQQHERFRAECERAQEAGIKLIILVEEKNINSLDDVAKWQNPRLKNWCYVHAVQKKGKMLYKKIAKQPPINSERLAKTMQTMTDKYGVEWQFCNKKHTGKRIIEILEDKK